MGWILVVATAAPLARTDFWAVRVLDFPRSQILVMLLAVLAGHLWLREDATAADYAFVAMVSICIAYQLVRIWPYTRVHKRQVHRAATRDERRSLSILISNVLMTNRESGKLRDLIRRYDPDIILTLETDAWWEKELAEFERTHAQTLKHPQSNTYGMLLYSRLPLIEPRLRFLVQDDVPSVDTGVRLRSNDEVRLRCLHPRPPVPGESTRSTERDAELLIVARELENQDVPCVVVGDLNDVAWSHTNSLFQRISGLLDPRIGRGLYSTFNANWPLIRFPVDHAFVSRHFEIETFEVLPHVGSDHFPVFARLCLAPEAVAVNEQPPEPTTDDERQAVDKIARASRTV